MIEVLKILASNLLKILSVENIANVRKNKKLNNLGVEIFLLYSNLNTILVCGREIIKELENASRWMKRKIDHGEINREYQNQISSLLKNQLIQLNQFIQAYYRIGNQLELLSPEFKLNLYPIIGDKISVLSILTRCISGEIGQSTQLISIDEKRIIELMENPRRFYGFREAEELIVINHGIENTDNLTAESYDIIQRYLESGIPYKRLDEIESLTKKLNVLIKENFTIDNILIAVGNKKILPKMPTGFYTSDEFDKYK
ncbi:MAG: hypothetical protein AAFX55_20095 [Bacteroidota bacterium]